MIKPQPESGIKKTLAFLKMTLRKKGFISFAALLFVVFFLFRTILKEKYWKIDFVIKNDGAGYYAYLPAIFVEKDLSLKFLDDPSYVNVWKYAKQRTDDGKYYIKYSCAVAILHTPFFFTAYTLAPHFGQTQDGFSDIFEIAILIGCVVYTSLGMFFLRKTLIHYFSDFVTGLTLLTIGLGTNLFLYATGEPGMAHAYSFCMISIFLWQTIVWYRDPGIKNSILIGLLAGIIFLLRPINGLALLIFPLSGVLNLSQLKERVNLFYTQKWKMLLILFFGLIVLVPQLLYWKYYLGSWFFDSYPGEHFFFSHPHITDGLLSYRNGWLVYTPVMCFALVGLLLLKKRAKEFTYILPIYFVLNLVIVLSWWCWWYSGFGNRALIDSYPLMALGMASAFSFLTNRSGILSVMLCLLLYGAIKVNWTQQWQYKNGVMHWAAMSKEAYWIIFMKKQMPPERDSLLKEPDIENARQYGREKTP